VIPSAIVMCESKGTNERPNGASAAGYYQITSETWAEGGGSPPDDASQHSKAEQDAVAARLWAGGAGAGRWVCKG
jgi:muramidase (phage lysozyme)